MKKSTRKLVLRSETIRAFSAMEILGLARVRGGEGAAALGETMTNTGPVCTVQLGSNPTATQSGIECGTQVRALTKG